MGMTRRRDSPAHPSRLPRAGGAPPWHLPLVAVFTCHLYRISALVQSPFHSPPRAVLLHAVAFSPGIMT